VDNRLRRALRAELHATLHEAMLAKLHGELHQKKLAAFFTSMLDAMLRSSQVSMRLALRQ